MLSEIIQVEPYRAVRVKSGRIGEIIGNLYEQFAVQGRIGIAAGR
jgi:hypothetical protein